MGFGIIGVILASLASVGLIVNEGTQGGLSEMMGLGHHHMMDVGGNHSEMHREHMEGMHNGTHSEHCRGMHERMHG